MTKLLYATFPILLLVSCATTLTPEQKFKRVDKNGDGMVTRVEATNQMIGEAFAMYDLNKDGFVSEAEYVQSGGKAENFRKANKSGTGKISLQEAQASRQVFDIFAVSFDEADVNKDGKATLLEYQNYLKSRDAAVR